MRALLPLLVAASALAQSTPASPPTAAASDWDTRAALVVVGSIGATSAGDAYEDTLASAHTDPVHEDLAFGGAELFGRMGRDWADGRLEVMAAFHVHRHPGEPTGSELEEVHAEWSRGAIKARVGIFQAPLGLANTLHAHAWTFANAPLLHGRFLGPDGLRNPGVQLAWETDPGWSLWTLALQRATGDTAFSFRSGHEGADHLGRVHDAGLGSGPLVTLRNERAYRLGDGQALASGVSVAAGDNGTGGATWIGAWDLEWRREAGAGRWQSLELELLYRDYEALAGLDSLGAPVAPRPSPRGTSSGGARRARAAGSPSSSSCSIATTRRSPASTASARPSPPTGCRTSRSPSPRRRASPRDGSPGCAPSAPSRSTAAPSRSPPATRAARRAPASPRSSAGRRPTVSFSACSTTTTARPPSAPRTRSG